MFERYTEKARRVIFFARYESSQFGAASIEPHHLLLGLIREDRQAVTRFCKSQLPPVDVLRDRIVSKIGTGERDSTAVDLPLSSPAKEVLAYTAEEAERLNHRHIGTEHMLLGLLRGGGKVITKILNEYGVVLDEVRQKLRDEVSAKNSATTGIRQVAMVEEMRKLAAEARNLAAEIVSKAEQIDSICERLTDPASGQDEEGLS
jgi:ATP-dependent Clp protease ATP-binding subunit ClpC